MKTKKMFKKGSALTAAMIVGGVGVTGALAFAPANFTATQQDTIKQAHELRADGNMEEARELMHEMRDEMKADRFAIKETVKEAVENNDYDAFRSVAANTPMADEVTEEMFSKIVEAHELREAGDREGAREIMKELGIKKGGKHGHHGYGKGNGGHEKCRSNE